MRKSQPRSGARLALLIVWTATVVTVTILGIGFAGGVGEMFTADNWPAWLWVASPIVPLALWLRQRARTRQR